MPSKESSLLKWTAMFDPLDFYEDNAVVVEEREDTIFLSGSNKDVVDFESAITDFDMPVTVLDLPSVILASNEVILGVVRLLRPNIQVNFQSSGIVEDNNNNTNTVDNDQLELFCQEKDFDFTLQTVLLNWYQKTWPNPNLNTLSKIINKIPSLKDQSQFKDQLLNYYTSILKKFNSDDEIIHETSQRISELCGRSALPSMYRNFTFTNLKSSIKLFEPSLTNDNLGWKTWGSSLILSKILINDNENFPDNHNLRVLELGSGTGLVGISWSKKWQELYPDRKIEIFVTDLPEIVKNLTANVKTNNLEDLVNSCILDWTNFDSFIERYTDNKFDIILVADPIYSPDHPRWLINTIDNFLSKDGIVHLQIPIRPKYVKERQILIDLLKSHNFKTLVEQYDTGEDDWGEVKYLYRKISRNNDI